MVSHLIPLVCLKNKLVGANHEAAFLLPSEYHLLAKELNLNIVDVDHRSQDGFRTEILAYQKFNPDVIVDDSSIYTVFVKQIAKKPRVAIQRVGMFPGGVPRNKNHVHSMGQNVNLKEFEIAKNFGLLVPKCFEDFFSAEMKIVPGIRTIEVLPSSLNNDPTYVFSGPLLLEDSILERINNYYIDRIGKHVLYNPSTLEAFFNRNQHCFIVYFTFGNVARAVQPVINSIRYLLDRNTAVISNIPIDSLTPRQHELYLHSSFLPMHYVCSRVQLMVHHCGSGTYQYQVLYELPALTIGTGCYDREDVALRLQELEVGIHLPPPQECEDFVSLFKNTFDSFAGPNHSSYRKAKQKLTALKQESEQVMNTFNFEKVLAQAVG